MSLFNKERYNSDDIMDSITNFRESITNDFDSKKIIEIMQEEFHSINNLILDSSGSNHLKFKLLDEKILNIGRDFERMTDTLRQLEGKVDNLMELQRLSISNNECTCKEKDRGDENTRNESVDIDETSNISQVKDFNFRIYVKNKNKFNLILETNYKNYLIASHENKEFLECLKEVIKILFIDTKKFVRFINNNYNVNHIPFTNDITEYIIDPIKLGGLYLLYELGGNSLDGGAYQYDSEGKINVTLLSAVEDILDEVDNVVEEPEFDELRKKLKEHGYSPEAIEEVINS